MLSSLVANEARISPFILNQQPLSSSGSSQQQKLREKRARVQTSRKDTPRFNVGPKFTGIPASNERLGRKSAQRADTRPYNSYEDIPNYPPPSFQEAIASGSCESSLNTQASTSRSNTPTPAQVADASQSPSANSLTATDGDFAIGAEASEDGDGDSTPSASVEDSPVIIDRAALPDLDDYHDGEHCHVRSPHVKRPVVGTDPAQLLPSPTSAGKKKISLSPLRTLFPFSRDRALSANSFPDCPISPTLRTDSFRDSVPPSPISSISSTRSEGSFWSRFSHRRRDESVRSEAESLQSWEPVEAPTSLLGAVEAVIAPHPPAHSAPPSPVLKKRLSALHLKNFAITKAVPQPASPSSQFQSSSPTNDSIDLQQSLSNAEKRSSAQFIPRLKGRYSDASQTPPASPVAEPSADGQARARNSLLAPTTPIDKALISSPLVECLAIGEGLHYDGPDMTPKTAHNLQRTLTVRPSELASLNERYVPLTPTSSKAGPFSPRRPKLDMHMPVRPTMDGPYTPSSALQQFPAISLDESGGMTPTSTKHYRGRPLPLAPPSRPESPFNASINTESRPASPHTPGSSVPAGPESVLIDLSDPEDELAPTPSPSARRFLFDERKASPDHLYRGNGQCVIYKPSGITNNDSGTDLWKGTTGEDDKVQEAEFFVDNAVVTGHGGVLDNTHSDPLADLLYPTPVILSPPLMGRVCAVGGSFTGKHAPVRMKLSSLEVQVDRCGVCEVRFRDGDNAALAMCGHAFHVETCMKWRLTENTSCPVCRVAVGIF